MYIVLGISIACNIGLSIALTITLRKHKFAAKQLHYYNIYNGRYYESLDGQTEWCA